MLELEKYNGTKSRYTCPGCGAKNSFTRYIDTETGEHLSPDVGRCNRDSKCNYHLKPKQFFADNPAAANNSKTQNRARAGKPVKASTVEPVRKPDYIEFEILQKTLAKPERNHFLRFLITLLPDDAEKVMEAAKKYLIGTSKDGKTIFWQIDQKRRIRTGKLIAYDASTGKRIKDTAPNWIHAELKKQKLIAEDFNLSQCFFGEHLIPGNDMPLALVEAEKTAVIASIFLPDSVWLACGAKLNLKAEKLKRFADKQINLYPDADAYDKWSEIAKEAQVLGLNVRVSTLIEARATEEQKANGYDLADYLVEEASTKEVKGSHSDEQLTFQELINQLIQNSIFFELSTDDFKTINNNVALTEEQAHFLTINRESVLCHLQQMYLIKEVFDDSPENLNQFSLDINTLEAKLLEADTTTEDAHKQAVIQTARSWYMQLIDSSGTGSTLPPTRAGPSWWVRSRVSRNSSTSR